jgi:hypothetical protein
MREFMTKHATGSGRGDPEVFDLGESDLCTSGIDSADTAA